MVASVFISYIEIYNDRCYDLLDEELSNVDRLNMGKNLRVDTNGMSFVDKITEVECLSSDEIIMQYEKGIFI